jgi:class 3 adenylate cyclase
MSRADVGSELHERRLSAILAADVAGYSRLMGDDEEGTLAALKAHRKAVVDPAIANHRGRIVKTTGDGRCGAAGGLVGHRGDAANAVTAYQDTGQFRARPRFSSDRA